MKTTWKNDPFLRNRAFSRKLNPERNEHPALTENAVSALRNKGCQLPLEDAMDEILKDFEGRIGDYHLQYKKKMAGVSREALQEYFTRCKNARDAENKVKPLVLLEAEIQSEETKTPNTLRLRLEPRPFADRYIQPDNADTWSAFLCRVSVTLALEYTRYNGEKTEKTIDFGAIGIKDRYGFIPEVSFEEMGEDQRVLEWYERLLSSAEMLENLGARIREDMAERRSA